MVKHLGLKPFLYEREAPSTVPAPQQASMSFHWPESSFTAFQACVVLNGGSGVLGSGGLKPKPLLAPPMTTHSSPACRASVWKRRA